jgi:hypothetical protein
MKPGVSTGNTTTPDAPAVPDAPLVPDDLPEPFVPAVITGTVVPTALAAFLFFGLTGLTVLAGTVVLVALVGITDTATLNESGSTPIVAFATDTLDETHDTINKTNSRLTTTAPSRLF